MMRNLSRLDRKQLEVCRQKAFVLSESSLCEAVDLLAWAVDHYAQADPYDLGIALAELGGLQEKLGNYAGAAKAYREAKRLNRYLAGAPLALARSILRQEGFRTTPEVLALEDEILEDWTGGILKSSKIWSLIVVACCAADMGRPERARAHAREALLAIPEPEGLHEAVARVTGEMISGVDLIPQEIEVLRELAGSGYLAHAREYQAGGDSIAQSA